MQRVYSLFGKRGGAPRFILIAASVLAAAIVFSFAACDIDGGGTNNSGGGDPTVTGVTITPANPHVVKGGSLPFTASVKGTNSPAQTVTWSIETSGTHTDTKIENALLTVAVDETKTSLTVRATSTADTSKYGKTVVTVSNIGDYDIHSVTIVPANKTIEKGTYSTFMATVDGTNDPPQTATWAIQTAHAAGTVISEGTLTVAADETATELTIRATSTIDTRRYGEATVYVGTPHQEISDDEEDFGKNPVITNTFDIDTTQKWNAALDAIANGKREEKNYVMNITGDITITQYRPRNPNYSNGSVFVRSNVVVSIRGNHTVTLSEKGLAIDVQYQQSVILRDVDFVGMPDNNSPLIEVDGTLTLKDSATISGNTHNPTSSDAFSATAGGGVYGGGTVIMEDESRIFGNSADYGGGIYVGLQNGIGNPKTLLIMRDNASIGGNTAQEKGGGVYIHYASHFQISGGTVFGINEGTNTNTASSGSESAALVVDDLGYSGTAQYGTFSADGTFTPAPNSDLATSSETIEVKDGVLIRPQQE